MIIFSPLRAGYCLVAPAGCAMRYMARSAVSVITPLPRLSFS